MSHQPISLRTNWDDRFAASPRKRSELLRELPSAAVVQFRELTYVKDDAGLWEGGFRPLTNRELSAAIGSSDWTAATE